jgi:hypothetical protein
MLGHQHVRLVMEMLAVVQAIVLLADAPANAQQFADSVIVQWQRLISVNAQFVKRLLRVEQVVLHVAALAQLQVHVPQQAHVLHSVINRHALATVQLVQQQNHLVKPVGVPAQTQPLVKVRAPEKFVSSALEVIH